MIYNERIYTVLKPSSGLPVLLTEEKEAVLMGSAILGAVAAGDNVSGVLCVVVGGREGVTVGYVEWCALCCSREEGGG